MKADIFFKKLIVFLFSALFFFVPLFFTPVNSELFEFNKIILVYAFTVLLVGAWVSRMIRQRRIIFQRTPLDIPLLFFLVSQFLSFLVSIDRHTSLFGYYSRFNGGLLSVVSYLLLYWTLVSNCQAKDVLKFLKISLISGVIVSLYGILEHFGHSFSCLMFEGNFGVSCWIQDVQSRVFATLGQPNWLGAYLSILIPITLAFFSTEKAKKIFYFLFFIFYFSCLLFTGSRSGFLGLSIALFSFWSFLFFFFRHKPNELAKPFLSFIFYFLFFIFLFGTPFPQINRFIYYKDLVSHFSPPNPASTIPPPTSNQGPQLEVGGSESGQIRKIVWQGALDIFKHYPLFGSGVETFAYSYYNFRPMAHNLVTEWDFLYNKAHNEYLNFLSTTGILGLGSYIFFIGAFVAWSLVQCKVQSAKCKVEMQNAKFEKQKLLTFNCNFELLTLNFSLLASFLSILVSNFFGFSVVIVSLYFFLLPAFAFILSQTENPLLTPTSRPASHFSPPLPLTLKLSLLVLALAIGYLLFVIVNYWRADFFYHRGQKFNKQSEYFLGYQNLYQAAEISPNEPVFLSELSSSLTNLAFLSFSQKDTSSSASLLELALNYSDKASKISPRNLNILKARVKNLYTLSLIEPRYLQDAKENLRAATKLAPTDPKLVLNLGLIYGKEGETEKALELLQKTIEMKPNYEEARQSLALFYEELAEKEKAVEQYEYISKFIRPDDQALKEKIENLKK